MFAKLLKHEWRATRGIIGLLCVIILMSGLMIGGVMHYLMRMEDSSGVMMVTVEEVEVEAAEESDTEVAVIICTMLLVTCIVAVAVCGAGSVFFVIWRFYKSRFTDEGYLTFTLPVNHHQLLLSSFLNSAFSVLLVVAACFGAVAIAVVLFLMAFPQEIIWADVWVSVEEVLQQLGESLRKNSTEFMLVGFSGIVGALSELIVLMLAVTIGALMAKKHKILAAVAVYYGIGLVKSAVYTLSAASTQPGAVDLFLGLPGAMSLMVGVTGYFLMYWMTSKKLNLN